jgi:hypothetical protein
MPRGIPRRVTAEFARRGELRSVTVSLEVGALEDLEALCRHHYGDGNRSQVVRRAVTLLLAREAAQVVRAHEIDRRHAEREAEEARAIAIAREQRDQEQELATVKEAVAIARRLKPTGGVG